MEKGPTSAPILKPWTTNINVYKYKGNKVLMITYNMMLIDTYDNRDSSAFFKLFSEENNTQSHETNTLLKCL